MSYLRDALIALAVGGFLWFSFKLQPVVALVLVLTLYFSMRSINKRFPGTQQRPKADPVRKKGGKRPS
jgi:hypothetical protein